MKIKDIRNGMEKIEVVGRISHKGKSTIVDTRFGLARVTVATIEDETGSVGLNLWSDQIQKVREGDYVKLEGASARAYGGQIKLNLVGENAKITLLNQNPFL